MPGVIDKIRLNGDVFEADANAMTRAFKSAEILASEMQADKKIFKAAQQFVAEQEAICEKLDSVMAECIVAQRALTDKMRKWLDAELGLVP
jgi:purine-nucleoside phosphorylase